MYVTQPHDEMKKPNIIFHENIIYYNEQSFLFWIINEEYKNR